MKRYYLAYGSNLNTRQMRQRCPSARVVGTAVINDYELLFKGSLSGSYLTIEPKADATVPVGVWEVSEDDELRLDRYEGYPSFYYKVEMTVSIKGIKSGKVSKRLAFVYIMHEDRPVGVPSTAYLHTCAVGYDDFGFDRQVLMCAYTRSLEAVR